MVGNRKFAVASLVGGLVGVGVTACGQSHRSEAAQVMRALEQVRNAPKEAKGVPAETLAKLPCSEALICEARDRCAYVYEHLARGMDVQQRVAAEIERLENDPETAAKKRGELAADLDRAESEVNDAKAGLAECERAASSLRRAYGI